MQTNGTISPAIIAQQTNEYGEIVESSTAWGKAVHCSIVTNTDNRIGKYEDGEFRMSAFSILIDIDTTYYAPLATEQDDIVLTTDWDVIVVQTKQFNFERVRLTRYEESLGEFRVQNYEYFPRMGRIRINVV